MITPEKWANHVMGLLNTRFGPTALGTSMAVKETIADAISAAVAEAVAGEREYNCMAICRGCRDRVPLLYGDLPTGGPRPPRKTWLHLWEGRYPTGIWSECEAAGIRARGEGEG